MPNFTLFLKKHLKTSPLIVVLLANLFPTLTAQTYDMSNTPLSACTGTYRDPNGASNYSSNQDFTQTITPDNGGKLQITFNTFDIENNSSCNYDYIEVYDGPTTAFPLLGKFCGTTNPGPFTSSAANGELTFKFHSDGSVQKAGWTATLGCTAGTPMTYTQTLVTQPTITDCYQGFTDQEVISINIQTAGAANPFDATQFRVRTTNTTNWSTDLTGNVKIYYTGGSSTFSTGTLFGSAAIASPVTNITVNGTQTLVGGDNYFWLAYDIDAAATLGNVIDGLCNQVTVNSINRTPTPSTSPAGTRIISTLPPAYTKFIGSAAASGNWARSIVYDASDDTHVMAISGRFDGQTAGSYDNIIVKVDQAGDTIWTTSYGTSSNDTPYDLIKTSDGGFLMVGQSNSDDATAIKVSSTGAIEWHTFIDEGDGNSRANSVVEAAGFFVVAGWGNSSTDMYLWGLDKTTGALLNSSRGKEVWFSAVTSEVYDIINTNDGGYAIAGEINNKPGVVKLSSAFAIQWKMEWGNSGDRVKEIIENSANDYTVFIEENGGTPNDDFHVMRFTNPAGIPTIVWENRYDNTGDEGIEAAVATTGGYYIAGLGNIMGDPFNNEGYVMKISTAGTFIWDNYVGLDDVESYAIATSPSGAVVAGLSNLVGSQAFYAKVDQASYSCSAVTGIPATTTTSVVGTTFNTTRSSGVSNGFGTIVTTPALTRAQGFENSENCNTVVLPVELISFTVSCINGNNLCEWTTSTEINNDLFTLERSIDALNFETIGTIEGSGNSNSNQNYQFIDDSSSPQIAYYRLKQTDFNGKSVYFKTVTSNCHTTEAINLYPNPFKNHIGLVFETPLNTKYQIEIKNYLGQTVATKSISAESSKARIELSSTLPKGAYFLQLFNNIEIKFTKKIIKL